MKRAIRLVTALMFLAAPGMVTAEDLHVGLGWIEAADLSSVTILPHEGPAYVLRISEATEVYDDTGQPFPAAGLGPRDYVKEECARTPDGRLLAKRITLVQPTWRALMEVRD